MKLFCALFVSVLLFNSCKDEEVVQDPTVVAYAKPWKAEFLNYQNVPNMCGNHSTGYKLYYKDSLILEECLQNGGVSIGDSLHVNDSTVYLVEKSSTGSTVLCTKNGGSSWLKFQAGPSDFLKFHTVSTELIYCLTYNGNDVYVTGLGKSGLSVAKSPLKKGNTIISDLGTSVTDKDSTIIAINDTVTFIIRFK